MDWKYIFVSTLIFILIGYLIGSISFSIIVSKILKKEDIRTIGSKNAGATNALRNYGKKIGFVVFVLDFLKPIVAIALCYVLKTQIDNVFVSSSILQVAGLSAVIGHIWPIFFKFKGGKGAATNAGFLFCINWLFLFLGIIIVFLIVWKTKKVSIASLIAPVILLILQIIIGSVNKISDVLNTKTFNLFLIEPNWWTNSIFIVLILMLVLFKHKENIKRIFLKTENTI